MAASPVDLSGTVALITGGNSGIGRAIALAFANAGAAVAIVGRNAEKNATVVGELTTAGATALALEVDVSDRSTLRPLVEAMERDLGPIGLLVNNAGTSNRGGILTTEEADWDRVMDTNLTAAFLLSKYAGRSMASRRSGKIINVTSASATYGWPLAPVYAVSKAALIHLTKCLAVELGPFNVQVNAIAPGWVETEMTQRLRDNEAFFNTSVALTPAGRWAQPEDVAAAALYLASPAADFVTGTTLVVDGGTTATYGGMLPQKELPDFDQE
jgi:NAD(P)-dependent dehydrogenase (short-subunit alcohol dehydrogenase family)